jgi:prepilin-type N-terminal cleavage/methylation domain-containing protein/prepilin-type processing-associated H-X9-DG protein
VARRGFTLVELLIVLGIIMILIGLLMPSISRARQQAQMVTCSNQLRQIGVAILDYAQRNDGWLVPKPWSGYPLETSWPDWMLGEARPKIVVCPTAVEGEWLSYQLNSNLEEPHLGGVRLGTRTVPPPEQAILAGENLPGSNEDFSIVGVLLPEGGDTLTIFDPERHGPRLKSNYLFMDFHVDRVLPPPLERSTDLWYVAPYDEGEHPAY